MSVGDYFKSGTDFYADSVRGKSFVHSNDAFAPVSAANSTDTPINSDWGSNGRIFFEIKKPRPGYDLYQGSNKPQSYYDATLNHS